MLHNILFCTGVTLIVWGALKFFGVTMVTIHAIVNKKNYEINIWFIFIPVVTGICLVCLC